MALEGSGQDRWRLVYGVIRLRCLVLLLTLGPFLAITEAARAAPALYIHDNIPTLARVELATWTVTPIGTILDGAQSVPLSDIAFAPDGTLFGTQVQEGFEHAERGELVDGEQVVARVKKRGASERGNATE